MRILWNMYLCCFCFIKNDILWQESGCLNWERCLANSYNKAGIHCWLHLTVTICVHMQACLRDISNPKTLVSHIYYCTTGTGSSALLLLLSNMQLDNSDSLAVIEMKLLSRAQYKQARHRTSEKLWVKKRHSVWAFCSSSVTDRTTIHNAAIAFGSMLSSTSIIDYIFLPRCHLELFVDVWPCVWRSVMSLTWNIERQ